MAILDERTEFVDSGGTGAFNTQTTGIKNVGDHIDMGVANRNPGHGRPLYLVVNIEETNDGGGGTNGTMQFRLVSDSESPPAVDGSATVHLMSELFDAGDLVEGTSYVYPLPVSGNVYERYLGFQINFGTEEEDDCVGSAYLTFDPRSWTSYPDATNSNP